MNRFRFLIPYLVKYKYYYSLGVIFIILTNWIAVTIPVYLRLSIDLLSLGNEHLSSSKDKLSEYLLIMFGLAVSIIFVRTLSRILFFNPGRSIEYEVKNDLFAKLSYLQKDYYDQNPTGNIISRIQNDTNGVRLICGFGMMQFFNILTALSFTPYKMFQLSPQLTFFIVIPIIIIFIIIRVSLRYMVRYTKSRMKELQQLSGFIVSSLSGIDVIKHFNMSAWSADEFEKLNQKLLHVSIRISFIRSFLMPLLNNLENILKVIVLLVGGLYVIHQDLTIGELTAFIAYIALLSMPIRGLGWLTTIFETGMVGIASIQTIMSRTTAGSQDMIPETSTPSHLPKQIEVKNLTFRYPNQPEIILDNISFSIYPNQTIGILGKIGSGKTTLVNCLNRYLPVEKNQIFIDEQDITALSFTDVRSVIHTVSQDVFLFSDTIKNNILFGSQDESKISPKKLDETIYTAALKDDINHFPDNIQTIVGEKGIMLSGGQKQRISLARSMMSSCDLLILDNVLSAVDYETERFLLKFIHQRETAKSLLIVSHRVQALEDANLILVIDKGKIVDQGTHSDLIAKEGIYKETWILQAESNVNS